MERDPRRVLILLMVVAYLACFCVAKYGPWQEGPPRPRIIQPAPAPNPPPPAPKPPR